MGEKLSWVDIAIFPFIRQFSMVNPKEFKELSLPKLKNWLTNLLESKLFQSVMEKYPTWVE
jgi:glutathione S-transferase